MKLAPRERRAAPTVDPYTDSDTEAAYPQTQDPQKASGTTPTDEALSANKATSATQQPKKLLRREDISNQPPISKAKVLATKEASLSAKIPSGCELPSSPLAANAPILLGKDQLAVPTVQSRRHDLLQALPEKYHSLFLTFESFPLLLGIDEKDSATEVAAFLPTTNVDILKEIQLLLKKWSSEPTKKHSTGSSFQKSFFESIAKAPPAEVNAIFLRPNTYRRCSICHRVVCVQSIQRHQSTALCQNGRVPLHIAAHADEEVRARIANSGIQMDLAEGKDQSFSSITSGCQSAEMFVKQFNIHVATLAAFERRLDYPCHNETNTKTPLDHHNELPSCLAEKASAFKTPCNSKGIPEHGAATLTPNIKDTSISNLSANNSKSSTPPLRNSEVSKAQTLLVQWRSLPCFFSVTDKMLATQMESLLPLSRSLDWSAILSRLQKITDTNKKAKTPTLVIAPYEGRPNDLLPPQVDEQFIAPEEVSIMPSQRISQVSIPTESPISISVAEHCAKTNQTCDHVYKQLLNAKDSPNELRAYRRCYRCYTLVTEANISRHERGEGCIEASTIKSNNYFLRNTLLPDMLHRMLVNGVRAVPNASELKVIKACWELGGIGEVYQKAQQSHDSLLKDQRVRTASKRARDEESCSKGVDRDATQPHPVVCLPTPMLNNISPPAQNTTSPATSCTKELAAIEKAAKKEKSRAEVKLVKEAAAAAKLRLALELKTKQENAHQVAVVAKFIPSTTPSVRCYTLSYAEAESLFCWELTC